MEGIEILQTLEVARYNDGFIALFIIAIILFTVFIFAMLSNKVFDAASFVIGSVLLVLVIGFGILYKNSKTLHTEYIVTVDQSVNVVEFFDKYEVIEHEDKLWRIKEKENDN